MRYQVIHLERFRQQIEQEMFDSGSASHFINKGNFTPQQLSRAMDFIASQNQRIARLKGEFHILLQKSERDVIQEWVNLHKVILQRILSENVTDAHSRTRQFVAKKILEDWEKVQAGKAEFVFIDWYFLKDYTREVRKLVNRKWWEFWK